MLGKAEEGVEILRIFAPSHKGAIETLSLSYELGTELALLELRSIGYLKRSNKEQFYTGLTKSVKTGIYKNYTLFPWDCSGLTLNTVPKKDMDLQLSGWGKYYYV